MNNKLILFDGVCNLCNGAVQFVLKHDKKKLFTFASLQSETGIRFLNDNNFDNKHFDSFILIDDGKVYHHSEAALQVARYLGGAWKLAYIFIIVPAFIRDGVYNLIARNRYRWFGRNETCWLPKPEYSGRFIN